MSQTGTTCKKLTGYSSATEDLGIFDLQDQDSAPVSSHGSSQSPPAGSFQLPMSHLPVVRTLDGFQIRLLI